MVKDHYEQYFEAFHLELVDDALSRQLLYDLLVLFHLAEDTRHRDFLHQHYARQAEVVQGQVCHRLRPVRQPQREVVVVGGTEPIRSDEEGDCRD
jgi:hypothetical protein